MASTNHTADKLSEEAKAPVLALLAKGQKSGVLQSADILSVLEKLERMTDAEYFKVVEALAPFYPLDDEPYMDEDSAFGWSDNPEWDEIDPDAEIE